MTRALFLLTVGVVASAQNLPEVLKQGEKVFSETCATGYCHGVRGTPAGAPRLVGRGFDTGVHHQHRDKRRNRHGHVRVRCEFVAVHCQRERRNYARAGAEQDQSRRDFL